MMKLDGRKNNKGFTLIEMLIVIAVIAVLVGISIPVFNSQLEKSREATDLANVRTAYAEVMLAAMTENRDAVSALTGEKIFKASSYSITVSLEQKIKGWEGTSDIQIGSCRRSSGYPQWVGDPGDYCTVTFNNDTVSLKWGVDVPSALLTIWDNGNTKTALGIDKSFKDFQDTWSSAIMETAAHKDVSKAKKVAAELKKLGVNTADATFECSWGTIYTDDWVYGIDQSAKATVRPAGRKYIIVTTDGKVTEDNDGHRVSAIAIDTDGNRIQGTVEVSTNIHSCFEGRTSIALINFKPN